MKALHPLGSGGRPTRGQGRALDDVKFMVNLRKHRLQRYIDSKELDKE